MALQRILCIDDDPDIRALLEIALSTVAGFDVLACSSAEEALKHIRGFQPDLVLLDVVMPGRDGPETMHALRRHDDGCEYPTVYFTGLADADANARLEASGAIAIIAKPFDPLSLGEEIREIYDRFTDAHGA